MHTNTTHQMDLPNLIQTLTKKFGDGVVRTQDVMSYVESLGQNSNRIYLELRTRFGIGHGKLQFTEQQYPAYSPAQVAVQEAVESDAEIEKRINKRFNALDVMSRATAKGINRALIISGPAGLGKSFGVEAAANEISPDFTHIKGYIRPKSLYMTLYANRHKGCLTVFDDCDILFADENSLNVLKSACDSSEKRSISWLSDTIMEDEDGESIPKTFEFEGSIIFITNLDFQSQIDKGTRMAPHFEALMSRSHVLDLGIKNKKDYIVRIKQVLKGGMLDGVISQDDKDEIIEFIEQNVNQMRELSLRMVKKLADLMLMDRDGWRDLASITCMKNS
jgi:hypothetical protein